MGYFPNSPFLQHAFLSNILEKVVGQKFCISLGSNNKYDVFQSFFLKHCIAESVCCLPQIVAMLLDLSKAFNAIDQDILVDRIKNRYITAWFKSYVTDHYQFLGINGDSTKPLQCLKLQYSVSQGHLRGTLLFSYFIYFMQIFPHCRN